MTTPSQDYGEPWKYDIPKGFIVQRDGHPAALPAWALQRIIACVNACAGMADPTAEIQAMRDMKMGLCGLSTQETYSKVQEAKSLRAYIDELKTFLPDADTIYSGINQIKLENKIMRDAIKDAIPCLDTDSDLTDEEIQGTSPERIARRAALAKLQTFSKS